MARFRAFGLCALVCLAGCTAQPDVDVAALNQRIEELEALAGPPPASLDALYAPGSQATWQAHMFELMMPFVSMISDMTQQDMENATANFEAFRAKYAALPEIVPEWAPLFPAEPVDRLGAALAGGDPAAVMEAVGGVGQVCHDCHAVNMPKVHAKYRWPSFADVRENDPVTNNELTMPEYMQFMEVAFVGMAADLQQGQIDRARANYEAFSARFRNLAALCTDCHDTEREYYVDDEVIGVVDQLGAAVNADSPDPGRIMGLMQRIGEEACGRCHLVHTPAAFAQYRFATGH